MGRIVRLVFARASGLVPLRRTAESRTAVAFDHPVPMADGHVLIVPKRGIRGLDAMRDGDRPWLDGFVALAFELLGQRDPGWVLLVNGGPWQDVRQLHGHLVPTDAVGLGSTPEELAVASSRGRAGEVFVHPEPSRARHWLISLGSAPGDVDSNPLLVGQGAARALIQDQGYALVLGPRSSWLQVIAADAPSGEGSS